MIRKFVCPCNTIRRPRSNDSATPTNNDIRKLDCKFKKLCPVFGYGSSTISLFENERVSIFAKIFTRDVCAKDGRCDGRSFSRCWRCGGRCQMLLTQAPSHWIIWIKISPWLRIYLHHMVRASIVAPNRVSIRSLTTHQIEQSWKIRKNLTRM